LINYVPKRCWFHDSGVRPLRYQKQSPSRMAELWRCT